MTATIPAVPLAGGTPILVTPVIQVDEAGNFASSVGTAAKPTIVQPAQNVYQLATNATVAAAGTIGQTTGVIGGGYYLDVVMNGTTNSLVIESLTSDGTTYRQIGAVLTQSGTYNIGLGNNATVRLRNSGSGAITGLYASLS